jgi:hypothetical protein
MTEEEKKAMIQFFGTVHAQAKQTDQMVVGYTNHLRPISKDIQGQLEQVLHAPVDNRVQYVEPTFNQVVTPPPVNVDINHSVSTIDNIQQISSSSASETISDILKDINNNLSKIASTLNTYCNAPKKSKNTKQA